MPPFAAINDPSAHFQAQLNLGDSHLDVFAVFRMDANGPMLSHSTVKKPALATVSLPQLLMLLCIDSLNAMRNTSIRAGGTKV